MGFEGEGIVGSPYCLSWLGWSTWQPVASLGVLFAFGGGGGGSLSCRVCYCYFEGKYFVCFDDDEPQRLTVGPREKG